MTFRVGQKVCCVRNAGAPELKVRAVYTIEVIYDHYDDGSLAFDLLEVQPPEPEDWAYHSNRFRPIVERKKSIEIFTAMLNPSKRSVDA